jgi:ubiquinone/menaquinone biosynthesis C-methylase UbiE
MLDVCDFSPNGRPKLLDVCTGPGYVAQQAADRNAAVTALDFSEQMIRCAQERLGAAYDRNPIFVQGDAQDLPFEDEVFDIVCCNFGILHLGEPELFLSEARRVLKPGGCLAFAVWAAPPATEAFSIVLDSVSEAGDPNVLLPPGPPFFRFADPAEVERSLVEAGFESSTITVEQVHQEWHVQSANELLLAFVEGTARTKALLEGQTEEQLVAIQTAMEERFEQHGTAALSMPAVLSYARKL